MDDQQFLAAIAADPGDLDRQVAYADWLADRDEARSELLRTWVEISRAPFTVDSAPRMGELKQRYRELILTMPDAGHIPWLQAVQAARLWINPDVAEKFVRVILTRVYGAEVAASWPLKVRRAMLDSRWTVEPGEPLPPEPGTGIRSLQYFVEAGTGDVSDVAS
jgi:uncharacterized protein (TIGR02996 family)